MNILLETNISNVEDWIKFVSDYGATTIIAGIFLYVIVRIINTGFTYLNDKVGNKKHDKLMNIRTQISEEIQDLIEEFLQDNEYDRIRVIEMSNSVTSVAYLPFKYMSCTYEVCKLGKSSLGYKLDHLSTSLFTKFFKYLEYNPYCILDYNNKEHEVFGGAIYDLMRDMHEQLTVCCPLCTVKKKKCIGYVAVQKDAGFTDAEIEDIQLLTDKILALLGVMDK